MTSDPAAGKTSRRSRRKRRGHSATAEPEPELALDPVVEAALNDDRRQLDPGTFMTVDKMVGSFAQRRFGHVMPTLAQSFFKIATSAEAQTKEIQAAFSLWVVYGWKDDEGRRIIDMFAEHGLPMVGEQARVLEALRRTKFTIFSMRRAETANKQLRGRDVLRDEPMIMLDHAAFQQMEPGDGLVSWFFPVGKLWRPLGVATRIPRQRVKAVRDALTKLRQGSESPDQTLRRVADHQPQQVFWTAFRGAHMRLAPR